MPSKGTTRASPDLLVPALDGGGRRVALEAHLRAEIRAGRLAPGARLPSSRDLAARAGVSRRLVVEAYAQLVAEGHLVARPGSGTRVAPGAGAAAAAVRAPAAPPSLRLDLFPGAPDVDLFPRRAWLRAQRAVLAELPAPRLGYGDPLGAPELRAALAEHLGRVRGAAVHPERLAVTGGFLAGLRTVADVLAARGVRRIGVEEPGFPLTVAVLRAAGVEPVPITVDDEGLRVDALPGTGVGAVVVTPARQMPLGVVLGPERRGALLAWAEEHDAFVLEDDYDAEVRHEGRPFGVLQGLAPERVVLLGSASKTLAPALRLGWLAAPAALVDELRWASALGSHGGPVLEQITFARLLADGGHDRHLRAARVRYRAKRAALLDALAAALPEVQVRGVAAGLSVVAELPAGVDDLAVAAAALERGVRAYPLRHFALDPAAQPPALVLGYAGLTEAELREAVAVLAASVAAARR